MEDLFQNPLFRALRLKEFNHFFLQAEKNCWTILIPQAPTLGKLKFGSDFIQTHILRPSRFFQGEYETLNEKTVEFEDDTIVTKKGFDEPRKVKVLFEELFYNKEYKQFKVLCISQPLVGGAGLDETIKFPEKPTCINFLESSPINLIVLTKVKKDVNEFNRSYVAVEGFENHLREKVGNLCNQTTEALLCANPDFRIFHRMAGPSLAQLHQIIESYVIGILHEKIFQACLRANATKDHLLYMRIEQLQKTTQQQLGIEPDMQTDFGDAIKILQRLEFCITPLEKLICLQDVCSSITKTVVSFGQQHNKELIITTDNLLPIVVYVILTAKPLHLHTNLYYTEKFSFTNISTSNYGFNLITFQAATAFIESSELAPTFDLFTNHKSNLSVPPDPFSSENSFGNKYTLSSFSRTTEHIPSDPFSDKPLLKNPRDLKRSVSLANPLQRESILSLSTPVLPISSSPSPPPQQHSFKPAPKVIMLNDQKPNKEFGSFLNSLKDRN